MLIEYEESRKDLITCFFYFRRVMRLNQVVQVRHFLNIVITLFHMVYSDVSMLYDNTIF